MSDMAFYKILGKDHETGGTLVQYRRVMDRGAVVNDFFPDAMRGDVIFHGKCDEKTIQGYARDSGWVLNVPRRADDEIAAVVLRGRW